MADVQLNGRPSSPLSFTAVVAVLYMVSTALTKSSGRWNALSTSNMKSCCTLSNAFSLSRNRIMPPSPGCLLLTSAMVSLTCAMFSSYALFGMKPTCGSPMWWVTARFSFSAMHFASILYSMVVTETGRYILASWRSPFSLYRGVSTACLMVSDMAPRRSCSRKSSLSCGAIFSRFSM